MNFELQIKKSDGKFETLFRSPKIDWCAFMRGKSLANRFTKSLLDAIKDKIPAFFQQCPFNNHFQITNATFGKELLILFPVCVFKLHVHIRNVDPAAKVLVDFTLEAELLP